MESEEAIFALAALAQATRLEIFRTLIRHEPAGLPAGEVADAVAIPRNTFSQHVAILTRAGLVSGERHSRSITYRVNLTRVRELILFLLKDCCGGDASLCEPLLADLLPCCPEPKPTKKKGKVHA